MRYDPSIQYKFKITRGRRKVTFICYLIVFFCGNFILYMEFKGLHEGASKTFIGVMAILIGGLHGSATLYHLYKIRRLSFELGPEGILDARICSSVIPWSAMKRFSIVQKTTIVVEFTEQFERSHLNSAHHRIMKLGNRVLGAKGRLINPGDFEMDFETFDKLVRDYARAHNSPAARDWD